MDIVPVEGNFLVEDTVPAVENCLAEEIALVVDTDPAEGSYCPVVDIVLAEGTVPVEDIDGCDYRFADEEDNYHVSN